MNKKKINVLIIFLLSIFILTFSFLSFSKNENIFSGLQSIVTSQAVLITDFLVIGGLGGTFFNAFFIFIFNFLLMKIFHIEIKGLVIASFFTVFGFSFFGKNIFNILPIYLGGILYSKYSHIPFRDLLVTLSFTSALAPFISEVAFKIDASQSSYLSAITLGAIIGFIVTPLSQKMYTFHEGFNLYNLGFTAGILGAVISGVMKAYDFVVTPRRIISTTYSNDLLILSLLAFSILFIIGFFLNNSSFKGYLTLIKDTGLGSDFVEKYGYALTFINMGLMGVISLIFVFLWGQTLNGPLLAGILTVVGFSAYGKHPLNCIPILLGVSFGSLGTQADSFTIVLSALFGTSLAPITGVYGWFWGLFAGWLHLSVAQSIGAIHGGMNLYNNGFSAGIVAAFLLPIMNTVASKKENNKQKYFEHRKTLYEAMKKFKKQLKEEEETFPK